MRVKAVSEHSQRDRNNGGVGGQGDLGGIAASAPGEQTAPITGYDSDRSSVDAADDDDTHHDISALVDLYDLT